MKPVWMQAVLMHATSIQEVSTRSASLQALKSGAFSAP